MVNKSETLKSEAKPFLRYEIKQKFDSFECGTECDSNCDCASCSSESCACGTGAGECAHVPKILKPLI